MKSTGIQWADESMDKHLNAPKKFVPKNEMAVGGLKKAKDQAIVIAYLKSISNLTHSYCPKVVTQQ